MMTKVLKVAAVAFTLTFLLTGCARLQDSPPILPEEPLETPIESPVESPVETPVETPVVEDEKEPEVNPSTSEPKPDTPSTDKPVVVPPTTIAPLPADIVKPGETITFKDLKTTATVDFQTLRVNSSSVPKGTEMVSQEGKAGTKEIVYRVTYTNGKETTRELIRDHITVVPIDKIITVGTGSTSIPKPTTPPPAPVITYKNVTDKESVPFQTIRVNDAGLEKGKEVTSVEGKSGTREIITKITYSDGTEISRSVISNQITVQPVNRVILVGTKEASKPTTPTPAPVVTTKNETTTEPVKFQTSRVDDPNLEKGQEVVRQEGKDGKREIVTQITYTDGKETSRKVISNTVTVQPVNKIIAVGTKVTNAPVITYSDYTETEPVPFEGKEVPDNTMFKGETKVITAGVNGVRTIVTRKTFTDGRLTKEEVISDTITKQPVTQVIHYGTKEIEYPKGITSSAQITALFEAHNTARVNSGLEPLTWSSSLANGASIRAGEISVNGHFSHTRPNGKSFATVGSNVVGENIAYGPSNGIAVFNLFWGSASHKANIIKAEYKTIGISTHYASDNGATYWAVLFGY